MSGFFKLPYHILSLLLLSQLVSCLDVPISQTVPEAAVSVSPSFVSFSIEQDRWTEWVGNTSQNDFFFNTLDNLRQLTGHPPYLRIGADSADRTNFAQDVQFSQLTFPAINILDPYPEATDVTVGDAYYGTAKFLPPYTPVIWGVNFAENNLTAAFLQAQAIIHAFASPEIADAGIVLESIEIGNEADFYTKHGVRPKSFASTQYVMQWTEFAHNLSALSPPAFWGGSFGQSTHSLTGFSPQAIFEEGILSSPSGSMISTISQHHYNGNFCSGKGAPLQDLISKANIRSNLTAFVPDIVATLQNNLSYVLGETNSDTCHGTPGVSNTAAAALWALDYLLFATQLSITRVFFHNGIGFKYNLIQPVALTRSILDGSPLSSPLPPHVQPQYYAAIIACQAIGNSNNTRVVELNISDTYISGYAFYQGDELTNAVFINSLAYLTTTTGERSSTSVNLTFTSGTSPSNMNVTRLSVQHADDFQGLTWGGQTYETSDGRVNGTLQISTVNVEDGFVIQATEIVLLSFFDTSATETTSTSTTETSTTEATSTSTTEASSTSTTEASSTSTTDDTTTENTSEDTPPTGTTENAPTDTTTNDPTSTIQMSAGWCLSQTREMFTTTLSTILTIAALFVNFL